MVQMKRGDLPRTHHLQEFSPDALSQVRCQLEEVLADRLVGGNVPSEKVALLRDLVSLQDKK